MNELVCSGCVHYLRHYAFNNRKLFRVHYGHCTYLRAKAKRPDAMACQHYIQGEPDENAFVSKEYLSKTLLDYLCRLELLPNIYDSADDKTDLSSKIKRNY